MILSQCGERPERATVGRQCPLSLVASRRLAWRSFQAGHARAQAVLVLRAFNRRFRL